MKFVFLAGGLAGFLCAGISGWLADRAPDRQPATTRTSESGFPNRPADDSSRSASSSFGRNEMSVSGRFIYDGCAASKYGDSSTSSDSRTSTRSSGALSAMSFLHSSAVIVFLCRS